MRCLGITAKKKRCTKNCTFLLCHQHKYQWLGVLTIVALFAGLFQDLVKPLFEYSNSDFEFEIKRDFVENEETGIWDAIDKCYYPFITNLREDDININKLIKDSIESIIWTFSDVVIEEANDYEIINNSENYLSYSILYIVCGNTCHTERININYDLKLKKLIDLNTVSNLFDLVDSCFIEYINYNIYEHKITAYKPEGFIWTGERMRQEHYEKNPEETLAYIEQFEDIPWFTLKEYDDDIDLILSIKFDAFNKLGFEDIRIKMSDLVKYCNKSG